MAGEPVDAGLTPSPPRLLVAGALLAPGATVELPADEAAHVRSRRLRKGDAVVLLDGAGGRAAGALEQGGRAVTVSALLPSRGEPSRAIRLLLPCAEPARVEWAVEKGTECGAAAFVLVVLERSQRAHVALLSSRVERLRRIAAEAVKQCDRSVLPAVAGPVPLHDALRALHGTLAVAWPGAPAPAGPLLSGPASIAIGPEGGFSPADAALLDAAGSVRFGLGPRILRLETAAVAALALLVGVEEPGTRGAAEMG